MSVLLKGQGGINKSNNQTNAHHCFIQLIKWMDERPHILAYRLGVTPPQQTWESGVVCGICSHICKCPQKMDELGIGGENSVNLHHTPGHDRDLCRHTKNARKRRSSSEPESSFPSLPFARPITFCTVTYACSTRAEEKELKKIRLCSTLVSWHLKFNKHYLYSLYRVSCS